MSVAIISTPSQRFDIPATSIFYIKGVLEQANIPSKCFDMSHAFLTRFGKEGIMWCEFDMDYKEEFGQFIADYSKQFLDYEWIGISVFTYNSQIFTKKLLEIIRPLTEAKIVLGGSGVTNATSDLSCHSSFFGQDMVDAGLADHIIVGEGDVSFPNLINGLEYNLPQLDSLEGLPFPNYDDINFEDYENKKSVVTGSRGCVRKCTFCNVPNTWQKYRFRPGKDIANEIKDIHDKYGITDFNFSDALVNGSMTAFRDFCKAMADMDLDITWTGLFIFRKGMTERDWDNLKKSGCIHVSVGVESGSEKVRHDMRKKFSNEVMYDSIKQLAERGIRTTFLMMVGYPTETEQDFQDTLNLITWAAQYRDVIDIRPNITMILPDTQLYDHYEWYGDVDVWKFVNDEGELTYADRYLRWKELIDHMKAVDVPINYSDGVGIEQLEFLLKSKLDKEFKSPILI